MKKRNKAFFKWSRGTGYVWERSVPFPATRKVLKKEMQQGALPFVSSWQQSI